jgi:sugar (pentulose or hexulose) kinase
VDQVYPLFPGFAIIDDYPPLSISIDSSMFLIVGAAFSALFILAVVAGVLELPVLVVGAFQEAVLCGGLVAAFAGMNQLVA